jgi:hypothetical protein
MKGVFSMKTLLFCIISFILISCVRADPPPITKGKCQVTQFDSTTVLEQWCAYDGYWYYCFKDKCWRKEALPAEGK